MNRARAAILVLKRCASEEQRVEYLTVLSALAPERELERCKTGMIQCVAERLGVQRGARFMGSNREGRPRAFERAISTRAAFDSSGVTLLGAVGPSPLNRPMDVGDQAVSHGRPCTVIEIDYYTNDTCKLCFKAEGQTCVATYSSLGSGPGGARLTRPALLLRPRSRETRCDEKLEKARETVADFFDSQGARSPEQRDEVRRRLGVCVYEKTQALILFTTNFALYTLFSTMHPLISISFSLFKALRPWYVRRAKREVCLCKQCENYKCYKEVLRALPKVHALCTRSCTL